MPPLKDRLLHFVLRHCIPSLIKLLGRSMRFEWINDEFTLERATRGESCIFCFWHNRLLIMPYVYGRYRGRKNMCAMTSRSRDGEYISDVLKGFGFKVVRGSTSRGGEAAVMEMTARLAEGLDAAIVPDGPKGPCYKVQPGVIMLSQISGLPIVPASYDSTRKKRLKSWDRFIIPAPFSRGVFIYGDPLYIDRDADDEMRENARIKLEELMRGLNTKAASLLGIEEDEKR
jgi:lysophospholipid acyltransferase (LPLAT)-like uncharacterized protein